MKESYFRCESDDSSEEGGDLNPQIDFSISNDVHNTEVDEDAVERTLEEDNMKSSSGGLNKNINATCIVGNSEKSITICRVEVILILPVAVSKKVPSCEETTNCTINFLDQVKTWKKEDSKLKTSSYQNYPFGLFPDPKGHTSTKSPPILTTFLRIPNDTLEMPEGRSGSKSPPSLEDFGLKWNSYSLDKNILKTSIDPTTTSTPTPIADTGGKFEPTLDFSVLIEGKVKSQQGKLFDFLKHYAFFRCVFRVLSFLFLCDILFGASTLIFN